MGKYESSIGWLHVHPWKAISLFLVIIGTVVTSVCGYAILSSNHKASSIVSSVEWPPVELIMELNKTEFQLGEPIWVRVALKNIDPNNTIVISFSSAKRFDFNVTSINGTEVYRWSYPKVFTMGVIVVALEPGEEEDLTDMWNQKDKQGNQVPKGTYTVTGSTGWYVGIRINGTYIGHAPRQVPPITITIG